MFEDEIREIAVVDGEFVDAHLEGVAEQFRSNEFVDKEGAFTNLEYFVRELVPEHMNPDGSNPKLYDSVESAIEWASNFGYLTIFRVDTELTKQMTEKELELNCNWGVKLGSFDAGRIAFATTLKGAVVLSVVQYFRELLNAQYKHTRSRVVN